MIVVRIPYTASGTGLPGLSFFHARYVAMTTAPHTQEPTTSRVAPT